MANRSNRRRQNPPMSGCEKHGKAVGSRRANSPSWSSITAMPRLETGYTCAVGTGRQSKGSLQWGGVHIQTLRIVFNPSRGKQIYMTVVPDLSENLRRAFEHEVTRGNTVTRVDRPAGTRCPLAVVFAQPLDIAWFKASEPLTTAVRIWENHDSHY